MVMIFYKVTDEYFYVWPLFSHLLDLFRDKASKAHFKMRENLYCIVLVKYIAPGVGKDDHQIETALHPASKVYFVVKFDMYCFPILCRNQRTYVVAYR